jgi:hypothetical protein
MPKRKRDESIDALFFRLRTDLFHALKTAKGFERQRQSKRLRDTKLTPDKRARIENEIVVLKSLDLHQTAHAHLCSSLLKVKGIAESERLPSEIKAGVPKPELTEEEKAALHNVTSSLYNRAEVKAVVEKAVEGVCKALGVAVPEKKGKVRKDKGAKDEEEEGKEKKGKEKEKKEKKEKEKEKKEKKEKEKEREKENGGKKKDGINGGVDVARDDRERKREEGKKEEKKSQEKVTQVDQEVDGEVDEEEEEKAISQLDKLLGLGSDDEDENEEEELLVKGGTRRPASSELDPNEITTDEEGSEEEEEDEDLDPMEITDEEEEEESGSEAEFNGFSDSEEEANQSSASDDEDASDAESSASSSSRSPPAKKAKKPTKALKPTDSTFLPSLMGGYISGSESSASEIDVAPERKNRRGQRARQAIWEKKYGEKAKHLQKPAKGRDAGWDLKRGAVDGDSKPWKRGIRNPLLDKSRASGANETELGPPKKEPPPRKRDDAGQLHPSWEARRLAKAKEQTAAFQGKKITFD